MYLSVERPPLLYRGAEGPPADAWDLQIAAPASVAAWLHERRQVGRPSGLYTVGAQRAIKTVATALPQVPMRSEHHFDSPRFAHPHVHVLLAPTTPRAAPSTVTRLSRSRWTPGSPTSTAWSTTPANARTSDSPGPRTE